MIKRWILVADMGTCKILEQNPKGELTHVYPNIHLNEIEANQIRDKGARPPEVAQGSYHLYEPHTEWHKIEKSNFSHEISNLLNHHHEDFDYLTLVVSPELLGKLRRALKKETLSKIDKTIEKDLTKASMKEIEQCIWPPHTVKVA